MKTAHLDGWYESTTYTGSHRHKSSTT